MTPQENKTLLELLHMKQAEIMKAIEHVADHPNGSQQEIFEAQDLRRMRRNIVGLINEMTADFGAQETINDINEYRQKFGFDPKPQQ